MLDTLSTPQAPSVPKIQLDVSPPGVNDLNRPMLINTTSSRWRDLGFGQSITRPKYQRRRTATERLQKVQEKQKAEDLAAMSRLLQQVGGGEKGPGMGRKSGIGVGTLGGDKNQSQNVKRSRSEPVTYLPPIDEGNTPPGVRNLTTPAYARNRSQSGKSPNLADGLNRRYIKQQRSASRADSIHALPTLSRVKEEKSRFVDGCYLRGVQRHTGRLNMNLSPGRPPRVPRHSWEDTHDLQSPENLTYNQHHHNQLRTYPQADIVKVETNQVPVRLRDMDLNFPIKKKMESFRQWHENQFQKHLEHWKQAGNGEGPEKRAEALELLAKYKQKDSQLPDKGNLRNVGSSKHTLREHLQSKNETTQSDRVKRELPSRQSRVANDDKHREQAPLTAHSYKKTITVQEDDSGQETGLEDVINPATTPNHRLKPVLDINWGDLTGTKETRVTKGAKKDDDIVVYTDAKEYIEENNLLPYEKCRRIQQWLDSDDRVSGASLTPTSRPSSIMTDTSSDVDSSCDEEE